MDPFSDSLRLLIQEAVREAVPEAMAHVVTAEFPEIIRRAALPRYLSRKQLSQETGWSLRKIDQLKSKRSIPYIRRGRTILFPTAEVEAYLREGYVPSRNSSQEGTDGI